MVLRADIAFAVSYLARFQQHPSVEHWDAAKHVLRYLQTTKDIGITYSAKVPTVDVGSDGVPRQTRRPPTELYAYADASWAEDSVDRSSQTGYVFMYGNAAISWCTRRQLIVAKSSTEAEYISLSAATTTAVTLRRLMAELTSSPPQPVLILEDNQSTIKLARKQGQSSERTKHIETRHHFIKQHVTKGTVLLDYVPTAFQAADCLTKSVDKVKTIQFRQIILGC